jgi:hypothetical protein
VDSSHAAAEAMRELDEILEQLDAPFARAMQASDPAPHWRELAGHLRRAADLADQLSNRKG